MGLSPHRIILASASPRRRELLSLIFQTFEVHPSSFNEELVPCELKPAERVVYSAHQKAREVLTKHVDALIIAADTIVVIDGQILGKPSNQVDADRMLQLLSGKTHQVYTGIAVAYKKTICTDWERTDVTFRKISGELIQRYIATGEPMDKAGAYAIQGKASVFVKGIRGCFFNVVGLPIYKLSRLLEKMGYEPLTDIGISP
ncbi:MAG: Maf family protein [Armatimonadota bacterium]